MYLMHHFFYAKNEAVLELRDFRKTIVISSCSARLGIVMHKLESIFYHFYCITIPVVTGMTTVNNIIMLIHLQD